MFPLYEEVNSLDKRCQNEYKIPEILMMEHAALALANTIISKTPKGERVLIVCGPGNNGADGLACARQLMNDFEVMLYLPLWVKSTLAKEQLAMVKSLHVRIINELENAHTIVDALFGSGARELDDKMSTLVEKLNKMQALKIACDLPTGLGQGGVMFCADITVTMGALKIALFEEDLKENVGEIIVGDLGIPRNCYEIPSNINLLDKTDLRLPLRQKAQVHKGDFGHLLVLGGEKRGASLLSCEAAFGFGAGLVSLWGKGEVPAHIMQTDKMPSNTSAIAAGMGLGSAWSEQDLKKVLLDNSHPLVLDADICGMDMVKECINLKKPVIITPHPKEFAALWFTCKGQKLSVEDIQKERIKFAREFSLEIQAVLILKGAHTIIAHRGEVFVSPYSAPSLAKGGSGDVLAGMIGALLAQGYDVKEAAISSVLAHVLAANSLKSNSYALTPQALIEGVKCL